MATKEKEIDLIRTINPKFKDLSEDWENSLGDFKSSSRRSE